MQLNSYCSQVLVKVLLFAVIKKILLFTTKEDGEKLTRLTYTLYNIF